MGLLDRIRKVFRGSRRNIAFFIDGPNVIRKDVHINLNKVKKELEKYGKIKIAKVFLDQYASDKLIEAMINQGYEPVITSGDVDVSMAVDATQQAFNPAVDIIALMTRDADFRPVLIKAKELGKETIVVGAEPGFSVALRNTADHVILLESEEHKIKKHRRQSGTEPKKAVKDKE
ncbi:MAG: TIGR00288 family NYN domain-containing protein [Candidatus Aenigmarchaeota archaeon]|nr:TIGR00288 family NYN domain-containing protein [Candidatus Aenigmarchaeota archaeon]